jgi:predicted nucleic acid-binding protein
VPIDPAGVRERSEIVFLVDTSVWVEVFRRPARVDLTSVASVDEIVTCLPVIQEVLQGFADATAFRTAREAMLAFPIVESPLRLEVFDAAIDLYRSARRSGYSIRSSVDCLIAACALRQGLTVLHHDRDFPTLARVSPLSQRAVPSR